MEILFLKELSHNHKMKNEWLILITVMMAVGYLIGLKFKMKHTKLLVVVIGIITYILIFVMAHNWQLHYKTARCLP